MGVETTRRGSSESEILKRLLWRGGSEMSRSLARHLLTLGFSEEDQARMRDLAERNQQNTLSEVEHEELMCFVDAGHVLALLHANARKLLRKKTAS